MQIVIPIPSKLRLETRFKIRPNDVRFRGLIHAKDVFIATGVVQKSSFIFQSIVLNRIFCMIPGGVTQPLWRDLLPWASYAHSVRPNTPPTYILRILNI